MQGSLPEWATAGVQARQELLKQSPGLWDCTTCLKLHELPWAVLDFLVTPRLGSWRSSWIRNAQGGPLDEAYHSSWFTAPVIFSWDNKSRAKERDQHRKSKPKQHRGTNVAPSVKSTAVESHKVQDLHFSKKNRPARGKDGPPRHRGSNGPRASILNIFDPAEAAAIRRRARKIQDLQFVRTSTCWRRQRSGIEAWIIPAWPYLGVCFAIRVWIVSFGILGFSLGSLAWDL